MPATDSTKLPNVSARKARRLLLHAQGLFEDCNRRVTPVVLNRLITQMGFVQLDSINVIERAHHLTLFSRLHNYRHEHLRVLHEDKKHLFEGWTHDASLIPMEWYTKWEHRRRRFVERNRVEKWWRSKAGKNADKIVKDILARLKAEGPLQSKDFEHKRPKGTSGSWWSWKPQKAALEYLWWRGDIMVASRKSFNKVYDLTHRVLPEHGKKNALTHDEYIPWVCRESLQRLIIATPTEIAAFFGAISLVESRAWVKKMIDEKQVIEVLVESQDGSKPCASIALPNWKRKASAASKALEAQSKEIRLLSPFDPVLRDRKRAARLFGFEYRFEAFVPAPKRIYGYYVLPILRGDQLIGRTDLKHHRHEGTLEAKGIWWEDGVRQTKALQTQFTRALEKLGAFIGAETVSLPK